jgi:hypothetical protein
MINWYISSSFKEDLASISSEGLLDENRELFVERSQQLIEELTNLAL